MDVVTGLGFGLLVIVCGAGGLTVFAAYLAKRNKPKNKSDEHLSHA